MNTIVIEFVRMGWFGAPLGENLHPPHPTQKSKIRRCLPTMLLFDIPLSHSTTIHNGWLSECLIMPATYPLRYLKA